ncbi:MAG: sigma 54-interacting transcriptional regulator [Firmicutes bacterium]|jgi:PAS domain S-box-containing protein|nr:sigma 54-interacting transcriptional regulator [Bacillota bacterium]
MKLQENFDLHTFIHLIDNIYDEIMIWDNKSTILYVNKACYRHYGLRQDEIIGKKLDEFTGIDMYWAPSSIPYAYREKKPLIQKQKTFMDTKLVTITIPILDEENNVKYVIQSVRDDDESLYKKLAPVPTGKDDDPEIDTSLIYKSDKMKKIVGFVKKIAPVKVPCMILGETGTGKSLLAKYIHDKSDRREKPFISINMASISPTLIESEIFGYKKGAFTGANREGKKGLFELANGGTLFLDEIGELPMNVQAKFLHVLQEQEIIPIGGVKPIKLDVRVICATNCDLIDMIEAKKFREDLYHRLNVSEVKIPPLRERPKDLNLLISHFNNVFNKKYSKSCSFSDKAMELLMKYPWKGNVRELSNVVERGVLTAESNTIVATDLPSCFFKRSIFKSVEDNSFDNMNLCEAVEETERKMINDAYEKYKTTRKIAEVLEISQTKASRLIRKYVEKKD